MSRKPESRLQLKIHKALEKEFRCRFYKMHGNEFTVSGIPDLIGCVKGLFFGFEVKMPDEPSSEAQRYEIKQIRRAEGVAHVVETADQAISLVRKTLSKSKKWR